eukprot:7750471-Heterocapsa_arctica.AAC.1
MGKRFREKNAIKIEAPPPSLRGRAGSVRLKGPNFDITAVVGYPPPQAPNATDENSSAKSKGAVLTVDWIRKIANDAAHRSTPIVAGDMNTKLGLDEESVPWELG